MLSNLNRLNDAFTRVKTAKGFQAPVAKNYRFSSPNPRTYVQTEWRGGE